MIIKSNLIVITLVVVFLRVFQTYPVLSEDNNSSLYTDDGYLYSTDGNRVTITGYEGLENNIRIPDVIADLPVTRIGKNAFLHNQSIWSVVLPNTLLEIDAYAFYDSSIRCVVLPDGLQTIRESAFGRSKITSINIPTSVTTVERTAFYSCTHLRSVNFCAQVSVLHDMMFFECLNLYDISLPDTIQVIEEEAFYYCISLEMMNIPKSLKTIEDHAFYNCRMLNISVDDDIHLGQGVFEN